MPISTAISITHLKDLSLKKTVYRLFSRKINTESDTNLNLVDILMASTAFPIIFPPQKIKNVKSIPDVEYVDGGFGQDRVPFHALFEYEKYRGSGVKKVYIISRKSDLESKLETEIKNQGLNDKDSFRKKGITLDAILQRGLINGLKNFASEAPELVSKTYIWIPEFKENFPLFDFNTMEQQYEVTSNWARTKNPIPLCQYLLPYLIKKERNNLDK